MFKGDMSNTFIQYFNVKQIKQPTKRIIYIQIVIDGLFYFLVNTISKLNISRNTYKNKTISVYKILDDKISC